MTVAVVFSFLAGRREAVIRIARSRHALPAGALLVLSAGFAREYDGVDLLAEPWHLIIPFAATIATCAALYAVLWFAILRRSIRGPRVGETKPGSAAEAGAAACKSRLLRYASLLALFWATAPLAWLYAIPWERFASPIDAVRLNLLTLAVVSLWRVALMVRVVRVLAGCGLVVAGALVLTVSTLVVFAVGASVPIPLGLIMAGVRAPPEEVLRTLAGLNAIMISLCAFPILAIISVVAVVRSEAVKPLTTASGHSERVSGPLWMLSLGAVATWAVVLPFTQPPQQLRSRVEEHVEHGQFSEATAILASHPRSAFPPHWKPPPGPGGDGAQLRRMLELGLEGRLPEWAFANYFDALKRSMGSYGWWHRPAADEFRLYARLAERDESFRDVIAAEHDVLTRLLHEADEEGDIEKHGAIESLLEITGARATSRPAP